MYLKVGVCFLLSLCGTSLVGRHFDLVRLIMYVERNPLAETDEEVHMPRADLASLQSCDVIIRS